MRRRGPLTGSPSYLQHKPLRLLFLLADSATAGSVTVTVERFSPVRVTHPTVLLGPTPPSSLGATARDSSSFAGGDFLGPVIPRRRRRLRTHWVLYCPCVRCMRRRGPLTGSPSYLQSLQGLTPNDLPPVRRFPCRKFIAPLTPVARLHNKRVGFGGARIGVSSTVGGCASPTNSSCSCVPFPGLGRGRGDFGKGSCFASREARSGACPRPAFPGLLRTSFRRPQVHGWMETGPRPVSPQRFLRKFHSVWRRLSPCEKL